MSVAGVFFWTRKSVAFTHQILVSTNRCLYSMLVLGTYNRTVAQQTKWAFFRKGN